MADGPSELPQHYGGRTLDGEVVKRPTSPTVPSSPLRAYHPPRLSYSPERPPIDQQYASSEDRAGLRRRPSQSHAPLRRHSGGESDRERRFFTEYGSRRNLRARDDTHYRDEPRGYRDEYAGHPDSYERSRPPRTYRNVEGWERGPSSASRMYFEGSREDRDYERGEGSPERKRGYRGSLDGYDYDQHRHSNRTTIDFKHLTPEEQAEVLRLPWTRWMNSSVKNRKILALGNHTAAANVLTRLRRHTRRICRNHHVPLLCICRNSSRQHSVNRCR